MIDVYASLPHYWAHMEPIWHALPERLRGDTWALNASPWGTQLLARHIPAHRDRWTLVASWADVEALASHRRLVYVEHGAGQTYRDRLDHPAFSAGGEGHPPRVRAYICPGDTVGERWHRARPEAAIAVVGCPKLDRWHARGVTSRGIFSRPSSPHRANGRTVVVAFHWNNTLCPESHWAVNHYEHHLADIARAWRARGWKVLGTSHPRAAAALAPMWRSLRIDAVTKDTYVLDVADVLIADNTSLMYEAAALDIPVVALNIPAYRRHVEHGLRFWSHVPGHQVDNPADLARLDLDWYVDVDPSRPLRRRAVELVYAHTDGRASARAAEFVTELHDGGRHDGEDNGTQPVRRWQRACAPLP